MRSKGLSKRAAWMAAVLLTATVHLFCCSLLVGTPVWLNNQRLRRFADNLYDYPLPPNTMVVGRHSTLGKVGNGNNCWYQAQQSNVTTLPREEIEEYYRTVLLPVVDPGNMYKPDAIPVEVIFEETSVERELHFTLTLLDIGPDTTLDFRCH